MPDLIKILYFGTQELATEMRFDSVYT